MPKNEKKAKARKVTTSNTPAAPSVAQLPLPDFSELGEFYKENSSVQESFKKWQEKRVSALAKANEEAEDSDDESSDSDRYASSLLSKSCNARSMSIIFWRHLLPHSPEIYPCRSRVAGRVYE